jgi:hypothetical protein
MKSDVGRPFEFAPIVVAALFVAVSLPHVLEDVAYGETARLGLTLIQAGFVVGVLHALLILAAFDATRAGRLGGWGMIGIGLIWSVGIILIHGPEIVQPGGYLRNGEISMWILCLMFVFAVALVGLGWRAALPSQASLKSGG